ncbi:MAG: helix-turn-helix transcriptional regulator [Desulfobacterales bacterium]
MKWIFNPEKLRERRKALDMTLRELAEKAGISFSTVGKVENGQRDPSANTLGSLAEALGVSPNYFFGRGDKDEI